MEKIFSLIMKSRPTAIAFTVTMVWSVITFYIIFTMLHIIKRDAGVNFEAVLAMHTAVSVIFGNIVNFDFGSSAGSKEKQDTLNKINNEKPTI